MSTHHYKIGIDDGHGGNDPGAIGVAGTKEKDVTLAISTFLSDLLKYDGFNVVFDGDDSLPLTSRDDYFNKAKCNYLISIHCNSSTNRKANYIATFIQGRGGEAEKLANKIQRSLVDVTGWANGGVRVQNLHITRETNMPAILVECGFISNAEQEKALSSPLFQQILAKSIRNGLLEFLNIEIPDNYVSVSFDGKKFNDALLVNSKTYVPLRDYSEFLGFNVGWDSNTRSVLINK